MVTLLVVDSILGFRIFWVRGCFLSGGFQIPPPTEEATSYHQHLLRPRPILMMRPFFSYYGPWRSAVRYPWTDQNLPTIEPFA